MLKRHFYGLFLTILLISPLILVSRAMARSGFPPDKWWETPEIADQLDLSEGEKEAIKDLHHRFSLELDEIKSRLIKKRHEVDALLEGETLDETAVLEKYREMEAIRSELGLMRINMLLEVRKLLGSERFRLLKALFFKHHK